MNDAPRHFGTDGIRGRALEGDLSPEAVSRWGAAWASVAAQRGVRELVLGWDPRLSSEPLARAFLAGWGSGIPCQLLGVVPTPAVAWIVSGRPRAWGLMISASHNPPEDNGLKGFDVRGDKLSETDETAVERAYEGVETRPPLDLLPSLDPGPMEAYLAHLGRLEWPAGLRLVVDCGHGATAPWAERIFQGTDVAWIGLPAQGERINVGVGSTHLEALAERVRASGADLGIAFDGDGDRCLLVGPDGGLVDGDQIVWLLARDAQRRGEEVPGVVGTLMTNAGLERALEGLGIPFVRTPVGDKFMVRELRQRGWNLAAEASGHVIQRALGPSGDGLATALAVLRALAHLPSESRWTWRFQPWPLRLLNLVARDRLPLEACHRLLQAQRDLEDRHGEALRIVVRWSGTEPKLRLMVEARTEQLMNDALDALATGARGDLGLS
jgi:phosphoglucosamine mutase